ncbi:MAG: hypothetical protein WCA77_04305 [Thermoplasmata archaeon]
MDRTAVGVLALAPAAYAATALLPRFPGGDVAVYVGAGITILAALFTATNHEAIEELGALLLVIMASLIVVGLFEISVWGPVSADLSSGALVGIPFLTAGYVLRPKETALNRIVALQLTVLFTLGLLVAAASLESAGAAFSGPSFASSFVSANEAQLGGIANIIQGLPHGGLPLSSPGDAGFLITSTVAFIGLLVLLVRPQTGVEVELPLTEDDPRPVPILSEDALPSLHWTQRELMLRRSVNRAPPGRWPPGFGPILAAAVIACAVLGVADLAPNSVLLVVVLGLLVLLTVLGLVLKGLFEGSMEPISARADPWDTPSGPSRPAGREPTSEAATSPR